MLPQHGMVIVHPRAFKVPKVDDGAVAVADVLSLHLFSCVSACLSVEERKVLLDTAQSLFSKLDALKGRAS
jgi:hypothetical protein